MALLDDYDDSEKSPLSQCPASSSSSTSQSGKRTERIQDSSSSSSSLPEDRSAKRARNKGTEAAREQSETQSSAPSCSTDVSELSSSPVYTLHDPSSHPNLEINLQYTIRTPLAAKETVELVELEVNSREELYARLNDPKIAQCRVLTFFYTPSLKELEHLVEKQPDLTVLDLSKTSISDISPLSSLKKLRHLYLGGTKVIDLSPLIGCPKLWTIDLRNTPLENEHLSPLANLTDLGDLNLSGTLITDVPSLAKLEYLDLSGTAITDLWPLTRLLNLRKLKLGKTFISDPSPLENLTNLEKLDLSDTLITDVSLLGNFKNLTALNLSDTAITDILPLANLRSLNALYLKNTAIVDLTPLADRQEFYFRTNFGNLRREPPGNGCYEDMLRLFSKESLLTESDEKRRQFIATRAADYYCSLTVDGDGLELRPGLRHDEEEERCFKRARYETRRMLEIHQLIKDSEEFRNLSDQEKPYAAWIKAEMLASIEGRLSKDFQPSTALFAHAQKELVDAEELLSKTSSQLRDSYLQQGYTEETFHLYQLLCLRQSCKYGVAPEPHINEALRAVSCEVTSLRVYANYAPQQKTCFSLRAADYLFRNFSFNIFSEKYRVFRTYNKPEEASHMLQTYQRNQCLFPSLFQRLLPIAFLES